MRINIIKQVFKKEIIDILRDKKTIFMMIILPIVIYPILMVLLSQVMTMSMNSMEDKVMTVATNLDVDHELISILSKSSNDEESSTNNEQIRFVKSDNYIEDIEEKDLDAYIEFKEEDNKETYNIVLNSSRDDVYIIERNIINALEIYKREKTETIISEEGLNIESTLEPIKYNVVDLAKSEEVAGNIIGQILPFILIMGVLLGSTYPAIDMMAGEKERGTLETLFTLPISNLELVMGKYLAVSVSSIITALLNILSIGLTIGYIFYSNNMITSSIGITINIKELILPLTITFACILLFAMVISAISMCICSLASSFKDAQNYLTPLMFIVMIPSYVSMIPTISLNNFTAVIPVVNISLLIKNVLSNNINISLASLVFLSNLAFVFISVVILSKMFNSEELLFGTKKNFSFLEKRVNIKKGTLPSFSDGIVLYALGIVMLIYVGSLIQMKLGMLGIALTQVIILALPTLFAYYIKTDFKHVFKLKLPRIKEIIGAVCLWIGGYIIVMIVTQIIMYIFPQNMEVVEALNEVLFKENNLLINIVVIAIMPAICEEIFFRGFLMSAFKVDKNPKTAILLSSILFGFMHIDFIRVIPTAMLGIIMAYAVYKTKSIIPAMLIHFINNLWPVLINHFIYTYNPEILLEASTTPLEINISSFIAPILISIVFLTIGKYLLREKS